MSTVTTETVNKAVTKTVDTILSGTGADHDDAYPFCGFLCGFTSCLTVFPQCIGCSGKLDLCCFHTDYYNCKVPNKDVPEDEGKMFIFGRNNCYFHKPEDMKIACTNQYFCCDTRCGIPTMSGIPIFLTCCFMTCFGKNKFGFKTFNTVADLK